MDAVTNTPVSSSTRRERVGWYLYGWADHAFYTTVVVVIIGPYLTSLAHAAADDQDKIHPLGLSISAGSFYPYVVSLSAILSVLALPVIGAIADRSRHKRRLLGGAAAIGVSANAAYFFVTGDRYLLGGALFIVAIVSLSAAAVVYNSFLPQLANPDQRDTVSSIGWSLGYIGGGIHLFLSLLVFGKFGDSDSVVRAVMLSAALWWAGFTVWSLLWLKDREPVNVVPRVTSHGSIFTAGFRQLAQTLRGLRVFPLTLLFLVAYLIYNDGIQTVISQASLYATEELKLGQEVLAMTVLLIQFVAFGGALLLGLLARYIGAWKTVLMSLALWTAVVVAGFWLPANAPVPFLILGVGIGLVLGGSQALSRSLFSQLIPRGKEAEYFSFYAIADKGVSWLGPLVFGLGHQLTNSYRAGLLALLVFFVVGFFVLLSVPMRQAIVAAGNVPPKVL